MSQRPAFLSQTNAQLIFHLLNENYGDKIKYYPNFRYMKNENNIRLTNFSPGAG